MISVPNQASVRLHESMGFQSVGLHENVGFKDGQWLSVAYLQRALGKGATPGEAPPEPH